MPCGQGDQTIVDRRVGCRSICEQCDVKGKCSRCRADGIPVVSLLDLNVQRICLQRELDVLHERVHPRQIVDASNDDLSGAVLGV